MTSAEIIVRVQQKKLYVSGGPVMGPDGKLRDMFWVLSDRSVGEPRGFGSTLEEAYSDFTIKLELGTML